MLLRNLFVWTALVAGPVALAAVELFHPAGFTSEPGAFQYLTNPDLFDGDFKALAYPGPWWWFTLHMIQTPLVVLVGAGFVVLIAGLEDWAAHLSRAAVLVFVTYYTVLDAVGGIGFGRSLMDANDRCQPVPSGDWVECTGSISTAEYGTIGDALNALWTDSWVGGTGSHVSLTASWAAFVAFTLVATTLVLNRRSPIVPALLIVVSGWYLQLSHTAFNGPISFGLLAVATVWIWFWQRAEERAAVG